MQRKCNILANNKNIIMTLYKLKRNTTLFIMSWQFEAFVAVYLGQMVFIQDSS